ncbi:unnamed protein product, partial [Ectocarpus sp. 8 AP-2014]
TRNLAASASNCLGSLGNITGKGGGHGVIQITVVTPEEWNQRARTRMGSGMSEMSNQVQGVSVRRCAAAHFSGDRGHPQLP